MNAGDEFLNHILFVHEATYGAEITLLCAAITMDEDKTFENKYDIILPKNFTEEEYIEFVLKLKEIEYNAGFGHQELFGFIWYTDNTWSYRHEYDGRENWRYSDPVRPDDSMCDKLTW